MLRLYRLRVLVLAVSVVLTGVTGVLAHASTVSDTLHAVISADRQGATISRHIFGHFAEHLGRDIYDGFWTRAGSGDWHLRQDVIDALRRIKVPNLRWPGGCFADYYHWRDGIGRRDQRPTIVNTIWGGVTEDNSFGTHEFMELVHRLGTEPVVVGNVGSGTVEEMADWWEYLNFPGESPMAAMRRANGRSEPWGVRFWGVGNESWGCGGNMTPSYYADEFKRFATFLHSFGQTKPFRIATGPGGDDYNWTEVVMKEAGSMIDGLDMHHYTITGTWARKGHATDFSEAEWFEAVQRALYMDELIDGHAAIMDRYDPEMRVWLIVGEWGMWHQVEEGTNPGFLFQQNTLRDAVTAAVTLNILSSHADRVRMANIAQTVNVLQAMILTRGEMMILTPTYHVFELYTVHHDATLLPLALEPGEYVYGAEGTIPAISAIASRDSTGRIHFTVTNTDPHKSRIVKLAVDGVDLTRVEARILTAEAMNAHNTFEEPDAVRPATYRDFVLSRRTLTIDLPSKSIVSFELE